MSDFFDSSELYVYSSVLWLFTQGVSAMIYPDLVLHWLDADSANTPHTPDTITQNLLRAGALIPLILAALTLGLNFGNAMQKPSKSASTTPNLSAFLSQSTPILLILYFAGAGMFTYAKYTWSAKWILLLSTVLNGGFAIVGGLGLLFAGESKSGQGSGWLFRTAEERQRRKERRREKRKEFVKNL